MDLLDFLFSFAEVRHIEKQPFAILNSSIEISAFGRDVNTSTNQVKMSIKMF